MTQRNHELQASSTKITRILCGPTQKLQEINRPHFKCFVLIKRLTASDRQVLKCAKIIQSLILTRKDLFFRFLWRMVLQPQLLSMQRNRIWYKWIVFFHSFDLAGASATPSKGQRTAKWGKRDEYMAPTGTNSSWYQTRHANTTGGCLSVANSEASRKTSSHGMELRKVWMMWIRVQ